MTDGNATLAALEAEHGQIPRTGEVATGGRGRHFYFRAPRGLRSSMLGPGLDLKAEDGYVVAPPSRHRSGRSYEWIVPLPDTLDELSPIPPWLVTEITTTATRADDAADVARATPIDGTSFPHWFPDHLIVGTRHRMLVRLAGWLRGCGFGEDAILGELRTVVASRVEQPPDDPIPDGWVGNLAQAMARKPNKRFVLWERYEPLAATWTGRAGRTDRHVLRRAVLPIVVRHRKLHGAATAVPIPTLTVATMADIGDRTASRSLRRLREVRGVLDYAGGRARVEDAHRYRLRPPVSASRGDQAPIAIPVHSTALGHCAKIPHLDLYREIFLPRGLGPAAEDVFRAFRLDGSQSAATLSRLALCHLGTAYRALNRMAAHGLVVKAADGWRRVKLSRERLLEIAITLGVHGMIASAKSRRQTQRVAYHAPASQKRRQRDAAIRRELQERVLSLAGRMGWSSVGNVAGERSWRAHVKRSRTRALWTTLRVLTQRRTPARAKRTSRIESCSRRHARGRAS